MQSLKFIFFLLPFLMMTSVSAQIFGPVNSEFNTIRQNGVSNMEAIGDTVWIGPALNRNIDNRPEWFIPENADSVTFGRGRVFSLALAPDTVVTGLGFNTDLNESSVATAQGYYFSVNGGDDWRFEPFPLDPEPQLEECSTTDVRIAACDTTFIYGGVEYERIRFTVAQQSPPFDVDFSGNTVLSVNWASGLLRSQDFGKTWDRLILPPITADSLVPTQTYEWISSANGEQILRYDPRADRALLGFGLLIDSSGRTWVGTAGGLNISDNALTAPVDSISWNHINFTGAADGLTGGWIIAIEEDPATGTIWMTNWLAESGDSSLRDRERFSVVSTSDGGQTFEQHLIGEKINDIGFKDGAVFAAGDNGLFISHDGGKTWQKSPRLQSPNAFIKEDAEFFSATATTERIWIGTSDGIATSVDLGNTWQIIRTNVPLKGGNFYQPDAPDVETYAYPNPFSPTQHDVVRIKFELNNPGDVRVRIFDFSMALVKEINGSSVTPGDFEAVWDGTDQKGRQVANGPYIYVIETDNHTIDGKILLVD